MPLIGPIHVIHILQMTFVSGSIVDTFIPRSRYGSTGPEKDTAGYDMAAFWARSGAADAFRLEEMEYSTLIPGGFGDHTTALSAAGGISAALVKAYKTGEGSVVETSLLRTGLYANSWPIAYQMALGGADVQDKIDQVGFFLFFCDFQ